ncbi:MAG: SCO family protein [Acetobacteraceae bacterium]
MSFGRRAFGLGLAATATSILAACQKSGDPKWHNINITGSFPALAFTMQRASDGKEVTAAGYRGRVVLLYFGYTHCPDVCPTTLANLAIVLKRLGPVSKDVSVLFATVDPNRDTLPVLARYVALFAPEIVGLRGNKNQIASLARRYRVAYSVSPGGNGHPYEVSHSSAIYVFGRSGDARLIIPSMATTNPDIDGTVEDLKALVRAPGPGLLERIFHAV